MIATGTLCSRCMSVPQVCRASCSRIRFTPAFAHAAGVQGQKLTVWWDASQFADDTLDIEGDPPTVRVDGLIWERGLSSTQARELAAVLTEGADEIARWFAPDRTPREQDAQARR
jgi:hypothetical protein